MLNDYSFVELQKEIEKRKKNLAGKFAIKDKIVYLIEEFDEDSLGFVWCSDKDGEIYRLWIDSFDHIYDNEEK